jgi:hypothetical protein
VAVFEVAVAEIEDQAQELNLERGVGVTFALRAMWRTFVPNNIYYYRRRGSKD